METIAIVFFVIWFVSGCYIGYSVNHYYDKLLHSPFDIERYWRMCSKEKDKFQIWILIINISAFVIGVIAFVLIV
jgi:hypothetical protein